MDKVIIDGIDISGCPFYQYQTKEDYEMRYPESGDCEIGLAGYLFDYSRITEELEKACIDNPNCYYKQLKRLQAENEDLKTYIKRMDKPEIKTVDSEIALLNAELQAENERLKQEKQELNIEIVSLTSKLFTLEKSSNDLSQCANKLYKALQEIRDILSQRIAWTGIPNDDEKEILDKINSVIGAEQIG